MPEILQPAVYDPAALGTLVDTQYAMSPLDQRRAFNVVDNDSTIPTYYFAASYSPSSTYLPSAVSPRDSDDFPTPKARLFDMTPQASPRFPLHSATYPQPNRAGRAD